MCEDAIGLSCESNICRCNFSHFWNGAACQKQKSHGDACLTSNYCQGNSSLECHSGVCKCKRETFWNGMTCCRFSITEKLLANDIIPFLNKST